MGYSYRKKGTFLCVEMRNGLGCHCAEISGNEQSYHVILLVVESVDGGLIRVVVGR